VHAPATAAVTQKSVHHSACYAAFVDALLKSSIELAAGKTPGEKLAEALELMEWGIGLERARLRAQNPQALEEEIDRMLTAWLCRDDG